MRTSVTAVLLVLLGVAAPARAQRPGDIVITEVLVNPGGTILDANGEWFELYNRTSQAIDLKDWFVQDSAASGLRPPHKITASVIIPAGGFVVLGNTTNTTSNGGVPVTYAYGAALALPNSLDAIRVLAPSPNGVDWTAPGASTPNLPPDSLIIDRVRYASASISAQNGVSRELLDDGADNQNMDNGNWADALVTSVYGPGGRGTPMSSGLTQLPVELVSFAGAADGTAARLTWATASETNNAGFHVERQAGAAWTTVGFVAGHGTTSERHAYAHDVAGLLPGRHTFRLRQVDLDGTAHLSAALTVEVGVVGRHRVTVLGGRTIRIEADGAQTVTVAVYDVLGRRQTKVAAAVDGPAAEVALPALTPGAYVVRVTGARFALAAPFVVR